MSNCAIQVVRIGDPAHDCQLSPASRQPLDAAAQSAGRLRPFTGFSPHLTSIPYSAYAIFATLSPTFTSGPPDAFAEATCSADWEI